MPVMLTFVVAFALGAISQPQSNNSNSAMLMRQHAKGEYERQRQTAVAINRLASNIQSEANADVLVSEIANVFANELPPDLITSALRQRVAHTEYEIVRNHSVLIPEQRVVDVWNQYVSEIQAPDETLVTVAEVHNMRDGEFTAAKLLWARGSRTIWTVPNIYATGPNGQIADGCRAVEALRVLYDLEGFENLRAARDRVRRGILPSEMVKRQVTGSKAQAKFRLEAHPSRNPLRAAEHRYVQEHGLQNYNALLISLFDELFPRE